jgi:hypothetical protein
VIALNEASVRHLEFVLLGFNVAYPNLLGLQIIWLVFPCDALLSQQGLIATVQFGGEG